jgi:hypothetical protein
MSLREFLSLDTLVCRFVLKCTKLRVLYFLIELYFLKYFINQGFYVIDKQLKPK